MKMNMKNSSHEYYIIDLGTDMNANVINIKGDLVRWCLGILSNT